MENTKKFTILNRTFIIQFPNVGEELQIESLKQALSAGKYADMFSTPLINAQTALDLIDAIAFYSVMTPDLVKDMSTKDFSSIPQIEMKPLMKCYKDEIFPWLKACYLELRKDDDTEKKEETAVEA